MSAGLLSNVESGVVNLSRETGVAGKLAFAGAYSIFGNTGVVGAGMASGGTIFSIQWTSSTKIFVLDHFISRHLRSDSAAFAPAEGNWSCGLYHVTSFTVADSGGTSLTSAFAASKVDTSHANSAVTDARVSSTGALTDGTRTTGPYLGGTIIQPNSSTYTEQLPAGPSYVYDASRREVSQPIVLRQNDGLVVKGFAKATGNWVYGFQLAWREYTL